MEFIFLVQFIPKYPSRVECKTNGVQPLYKVLGTILYFLESVPCSWALKNAMGSCLGNHTCTCKGMGVVSLRSL